MRGSTPPAGGAAGRAVVVLSLVQFVDVLGVTSAIVAIPSMIRGVGASGSLAAPLATAYAMLFGGLLIVGARLADKLGHRRVLVSGLAVFAAAGGLGWAAQAGWQLVLARAVQGTASALTVPAALSLLLATAGTSELRTRALGLWSAAGATAGATGLFLGGFLTDTLGWRSVFWVNIPIAVLLGAGVLAWVHARPATDRAARVDVVGAALLTGTVMAAVLGASFLQEPSRRTLGGWTVAAAVLLGVLLVAWLQRSRSPILRLSTLRLPRLAAGSVGSFVNTAATSSTAVLLTLHLQDTDGLSAFQAGLALLPLSVSVVPGSMLAGQVTRRLGARGAIAVGLSLLGAGNGVVALALGHTLATTVGLLLLGLGLGISSVACNDLGTDLPEEHVSTATGVLNTAAQLGTALGVAALVLLASTVGTPAGRGTELAVLAAAGGTLAAVVGIGRWRSAS